MSETHIGRRDLLTAGAILSVGAAGLPAMASAAAPAAAGYVSQPQPLPFDPGTIAGLSE